MKKFKIVALVAIMALAGITFANTATGQGDPDAPDRGVEDDGSVGSDGSFAGGDVGTNDRDPGEGGAGQDQVIFDDLIVDGSICNGLDCINGESFGFDTLRLKENNLRIRFVDTSTAASFPSNDWQLTANDSTNGGQNKFSIDDVDGGRTPFTLEAGAPSHSLYVDSGGRLGLGTNAPVVDVHVKTGNTPTLRLEQDGTSGFTAQTWDVAGNEAGFFVRDATSGSTLPFRIRPGAPSSALDVAPDGDVSMGTTANDATLHVADASNVQIMGQSTGNLAVQFRLRTDSENRRIVAQNTAGVAQAQIVMGNDGAFQLTGVAGVSLRLEPRATAPVGAVAGTVYVDSTGGDSLCVRLGAAWVSVASGAGGDCV